MLAAYAHERVAAGRDVPNDVWPWIDRFPPEAELAAIADELHANAHARRRAAAAALAQHDAHPSEELTCESSNRMSHMTSSTTDDYEAMAAAGVKAIVEPAFWLGQPRSSVGTFVDYFNSLLGWEPFRASQFGIAHHCAIALNPKEANDPALRDGVLELLPRYLVKDRVVAVGEVGYDAMTPEEDEVLAAQLDLGIEHDLPVLVHTPHRDKLAGVAPDRSTSSASPDFPPERVLLDHNNELTVRDAKDSGCWVGFSIYPEHEDGRGPDGRRPPGGRAPTGCSSTRRRTGGAATR